MIKLTLLTFALSLLGHAHACEIHLNDIIFIASSEKINNWKDIIVKSGCDEITDLKVVRFVTAGLGSVRTAVLSSEAGLENIQITPKRIEVKLLTDHLKDELGLAPSYEIENLTLADGAKFIAITSMDQVKVQCDQCTQLGEAALKVQIERSGKLEVKWARAAIAQKVLAFFPKRHIGINQKYLSAEDFEARSITTKKPGELFNDLEQVEYFSTVRALNPENPLKQSDLYAQNLVSPQNLSEVILSSGKMKLSTKGYPVKAARFGEVISVRNANSNRLIMAKVIGRNKVVVE